MSKGARTGLGKGLSALLPEYQDGIAPSNMIPIGKIHPNPMQPRKYFSQEKLEELAESIKVHGLIQPVLLREVINGYELIAGERRWRAAKLAGLDEIPAIIKEFSEKEILEIGLIENLQREDLNPIEEAQAYKTLMDEFNLTQDDLSKRVGKSRAYIANVVRLLNLEPKVVEMVKEGLLTQGLARPLLALDKELQPKIAKRIVKESLTARQVEELVRKETKPKKQVLRNEEVIPTPIKELEEDLMECLGTQVKIKHKNNKGRIEIEYYNEEDLERIIDIIYKRK